MISLSSLSDNLTYHFKDYFTVLLISGHLAPSQLMSSDSPIPETRVLAIASHVGTTDPTMSGEQID